MISRTLLRWFAASALCAGPCLIAPVRARAEPPAASPASAPPAPSEAQLARARALTRNGLRQFEQREYEAAILSFRQAYQLVPAVALLYNLAQAERMNGDCASAARDYRAFLDATPEGPLAELAREHLASCDVHAIDAPATAATEVAPPASKQVSDAPRRETLVGPLASPVPGPPRRLQPASRQISGTRTAAIVSFASSGAWLAIATYFGVRSQHASNEVSGVFADSGTWSERAAQVEDQGRRDQRLAIAAGVSGLVAAGLGVWLWTW
jgi:tetratricopeptide (TPR) repeat protein